MWATVDANAVDTADTRARKLVAEIVSASGPRLAVLSRRRIYQVFQFHNAIDSGHYASIEDATWI